MDHIVLVGSFPGEELLQCVDVLVGSCPSG